MHPATSYQLLGMNCLCRSVYTYSQTPTPPQHLGSNCHSAGGYHLQPVGAYPMQALPGLLDLIFFFFFNTVLAGLSFFLLLNRCPVSSRRSPDSLYVRVPKGGDNAQVPLLYTPNGTAVPTHPVETACGGTVTHEPHCSVPTAQNPYTLLLYQQFTCFKHSSASKKRNAFNLCS